VPHRILLLSALLLALAAGALSHTTAARAAGPEIGVSDDRVLLAGGSKASKMVDEWKRDGIDTVRIYLLWSRVAPGAKSKTMPKGFDPTNTALYDWYSYDLAVDLVRSAGMKVSLTVSGPGPYWSSTSPGKKSGAYSPSPSAARSCCPRRASRPRTSTATSSRRPTPSSSAPTRARRCRSARWRRRGRRARTSRRAR
jgi:hypothetical protein